MISERFCRLTASSFAVLFALLPCASVAQRTDAGARVAALPSGTVDLGVVPAATKVNVRLYLAPDAAKVAELDQFLADVQDVTSPSYRHWLTPVEFGARFGANTAAVAQVKTFAENQGLGIAEVSASGLRVTLSGTATQMEAVFSPGLHAYQAGAVHAMANTVVPTLSNALPRSVAAVGGFNTLATDLNAQLGDAVDANVTRVVPLVSTACLQDVSEADRAAFTMEAKEAAAQGITVLATSGCATGGAASFPAVLPEVTAVAMAPGLADVATELRPGWQWAPGLPEDGLRHAPDLMVSDVNALAQMLTAIAGSMPADAGGRLGNINATLYRMAPIPTVFTQPDGAVAGTWEAATGLGLVNLQALDKYYPRGSFTVNVSGSATNYAPTHGQATTLISTVSDISGMGGTNVPSGTITFATSTGTTLGTATLANGTGSITTSNLPGGTVDVIVSYSGDSNFAAGQGYGIYLAVQGEPAALTATVGGTVALGANSTINVSVSSASGLGTPSGSVTVTPQGIVGAPTYTAPLTGSNGTATATVTVPALQAGAIVMLVNCVSADLSFTCYSPIRATAVVKQAASTTTFTVTPNPPVGGTTTTFVATVTGAAAPAPAPTGDVGFYDNGTLLGSGTLVKGVATYTNSALTSAVVQPHTAASPRATLHAFSASYNADTNYQASTSASPNAVVPAATTTALSVSPNPPANGTTTTLTATVAYTNNGAVATGTVQFFEDGTQIGTGALSAAGTATFSSATITGILAHSFYAVYPGDTLYSTSQSAPVTTQANTATVTTTTSVSTSATTVNSGSMVTLTGTVVPTSSTGTAPTGTVSFTSSTQGLLGSGTLVGTTATLPVALTTAGAQSITASYSGDASYKASTSATPVTVTVANVTTPITLGVTPSTGATYSSPVTATVSVSGVSTTTGLGPAGSVVFSIAAAGSLVPVTSTVAIVPVSTTGGTATYTFAAPAPGIYSVTATCTGTNFTCTTTPATASLVTIKGNTVTTVTATPPALVAGATTTLTATILPASPLATNSTFTGSVTFYNQGGVAIGTGTVTGNQATLTTSFVTATGNVITAVYTGDLNWNSSTSSTLVLTPALVPTVATVTTNFGSVLQGTNIVFTVHVTDGPTALFPLPPTPSGQVTLYDTYNGQTVLLGTVTLISSGPYQAVGQLSTTGLFHGVHVVTGLFSGNTTFAASTSSLATVVITDYSVKFAPSQITLPRGSTGSSTVTLTSLDGFAGTISLACTPPPDTATTCSISPASLSGGGGASTLTIYTTLPRSKQTQQAGLRDLGFGVSVAGVLGCMLYPRRRRPGLLALVALCGLFGMVGCGTGGSATVTPPGGTGGTPLGTQLFTIVTSGTDGISTNRHDSQFQVTVQ